MEPLNSVAAVSAAGDAVEIWCGTQSQTIAVTAVANALGIPENRVKFNACCWAAVSGAAATATSSSSSIPC